MLDKVFAVLNFVFVSSKCSSDD